MPATRSVFLDVAPSGAINTGSAPVMLTESLLLRMLADAVRDVPEGYCFAASGFGKAFAATSGSEQFYDLAEGEIVWSLQLVGGFKR